MAGLSIGSMIPIGGDIVGKVGKAAIKYGDNVVDAIKGAGKVADNVVRLTAKEATILADKLGYAKTNYRSHGQPIFYNKKSKKYISPDLDAHNGGIWKMADSIDDLADRTTRNGTYDKNLNRIGD